MSTFLQMLAVERLKLFRSPVWLLVFVSPLLATAIGMMVNFGTDGSPGDWPTLLAAMSLLHAMLFLPIMAGIFAAVVCRFEHVGGGWKQLLALPVSRPAVYAAKMTAVLGLLAICQLLLLAGLWAAGLVQGVTEPFPWAAVLTRLCVSWFACWPIVAMQLGASLGWSSFGIPLALNVSFTVPNMLIVNSAKIAPFYPWAQPLLAMVPTGQGQGFFSSPLPLESVIFAVAGSFLVFAAAGLIYFIKKEV